MATAYYEKICQEDLDTGTSAGTKRNPGGGTLTTTQISLSSFSVGQAKTSASWASSSIANGSFESTDVTVSGAALGDFALASFSVDVSDLSVSCQVTATNTVTVTLSNLTGAAVALGTFTVYVIVFTTA